MAAVALLVWVPVIFWDDHVSRDLDLTSEIVKQAGSRYQVRMTDEAIAELASDADYYAFYMQDFERSDSFGRSVCSSARSTVKALKKQGLA